MTEEKTKGAGAGVVASGRIRLARLIGLACGIVALLLVAGALCISLGANRDNALVAFVLEAADAVDLAVFDRRDGVFVFSGDRAAALNALVNWGLAAVVWLVVGRVLSRLVRP